MKRLEITDVNADQGSLRDYVRLAQVRKKGGDRWLTEDEHDFVSGQYLSTCISIYRGKCINPPSILIFFFLDKSLWHLI